MFNLLGVMASTGTVALGCGMAAIDLSTALRKADGAFRAAARELAQALSPWIEKHATRRNAAALGAILLAHLVVLWALIHYLHLAQAKAPERELGVWLAPVTRPADAPPPLPAVLEDPPIVAPPEIVIADETTPPGIGAVSPSMILAPRPDPAHPNLPARSAALSDPAGKAVILKVLVERDGSVSSAQVVASAGRSELDAAAIAFVKANWHFLPAMISGAPISYWTTISVPIVSG